MQPLTYGDVQNILAVLDILGEQSYTFDRAMVIHRFRRDIEAETKAAFATLQDEIETAVTALKDSEGNLGGEQVSKVEQIAKEAVATARGRALTTPSPLTAQHFDGVEVPLKLMSVIESLTMIGESHV